MFEFFFKYRPVLFERGHVVFGTPWPIPLAMLLLGAALVVLAYRRAPGRVTSRHRMLLAGFRLGVLAALTFVLGRPTLVVPTVVPQQNFLAILMDDSRSMQVGDQDGGSRGAYAQRVLGSEGNLLGRLSRQFKLRTYAFDRSVGRVTDPSALAFAGSSTRIGPALDRLRQDFSGTPLAGIVLVTDGADNAEATLNEAVLQLRAARVPVYVVGVGRERAAKDIEVARLDLPRTTLKGSTLIADVLITHSGFGGTSVPVYVEESGRIVATQTIKLGDDEATTVRIPFTLAEGGLRHVRVRVPPQTGEQLAENNLREALVLADERRHKILYFEGEPRFEAKFIRRAVADDRTIQLVVLQRTAENKFLRLDVDTPDELAAGFPKTREELFTYRGIMLGSVEASQFTHDQLQAISDFVGQRGGGLFLLGGRLALAEGGYAGTPVAAVLPVELAPQESPGDSTGFFEEVKIDPTPAGLSHPALQLAPNAAASLQRWGSLPRLSVVNRIGPLRVGATALLMGRTDGTRGEQPVLAFQRYGRGKAIVFSVQDSWMWQMQADIPPEDLTHETLWQQLARWLVSGVPDPVTVTLSNDRVDPGDSIVVTASVTDSGYVNVNGAGVTAHVTAPSGAKRDVPLEWTVLRDGEYRGVFVADERGGYQVVVEARRGGRVLGAGTVFAESGERGEEFFGAGMRRAALQRIAQETGGRFYTSQTVNALPEDVRYTEAGTTIFEEHDLWDMPITFLFLMCVLGAEWSLRRRRGLA